MSTFYVASIADDGYYSTSSYNNSQSYVAFGYSSYLLNTFLRFSNVTIPNGANVNSAKLNLKSYFSRTDVPVNLKIKLVEDDNPVAPINTYYANAMPLSTGIDWTINSSWTSGTIYETPDFSSEIQAIFSRSGWVSGNALIVVIAGVSGTSGYRDVTSRNGGYICELVLDTSEGVSSVIPADIYFQPYIDSTTIEIPGRVTPTNIAFQSYISSPVDIQQTSVIEKKVFGVNKYLNTWENTTDDGHWGSTVFNSLANYCSAGFDAESMNSWFRFPDVTIPRNTTISEAYITVSNYYDINSRNNVHLKVCVVNADNASAPTSIANANATSTTTGVNWDITSTWYPAQNYNSPNIASDLTSIFSRSGWSSGNAIVVMVKNNGTTGDNFRRFTSVWSNGFYTTLTIKYVSYDKKSFHTQSETDDGRWSIYSFENVSALIAGNLSGTSYNSFIRFPNLTIPKDSVINSAVIRFITAETNLTLPTLSICFAYSANQSAPTTISEANAMLQTNSINWDITYKRISNTTVETPDLSNMLSLIVGHDDWEYGNSALAIIKDYSSLSGNNLSILDYPDQAELIVSYTESGSRMIFKTYIDTITIKGTIVSPYDIDFDTYIDSINFNTGANMITPANVAFNTYIDTVGTFEAALGANSYDIDIIAPTPIADVVSGGYVNVKAPYPSAYVELQQTMVANIDVDYDAFPSASVLGGSVTEIDAPSPTANCEFLVGRAINVDVSAPLPTASSELLQTKVFNVSVNAPYPLAYAVMLSTNMIVVDVNAPSRISVDVQGYSGNVAMVDVNAPLPTASARMIHYGIINVDVEAPLPFADVRLKSDKRFDSYILRHDRSRIIV